MFVKLTVFYEAPFWIGILEKKDFFYSVARVVFGNEPTEPEIYELIQEQYLKIYFTEKVENLSSVSLKKNPKKLQKEAGKEIREKKFLKKAFEVIQAEYEKKKVILKKKTKEEKEAEIEKKFQMKQSKKKEKHRGH
ncbi:MAG TPA: DUF2992 domain-containing protein [Spirochaetia bacterium]|nr:MAG: hypothetical protein A2Y41_08330 [Spirochaetes bacterium GWB1_36_13]HCL56197.1 DUF2992 domain-containing protein [Spirochaetia bacterium]